MALPKCPWLSVPALLLLLPGCAPGMFQSIFNSATGGLQVYPSSTTVSVNQSLAFQASGGTAPYQYQVSGVGSIDGNGNYQAGVNPGQAQIQITDANSNTATAAVSVVQSSAATTTYGSYGDVQLRPGQAAGASLARGWAPATSAELKQAPWVRGAVIGAGEQRLDASDEIRSKFVETSLKHPIVRVDTLIEDHQVVAARAVIEDQFLVTLQPGYSKSDLSAIAAKDGGRVSRKPLEGRTYVVSMAPPAAPAAISSDFLASRAQLKRDLESVGNVSPNYVSRKPADSSEPSK